MGNRKKLLQFLRPDPSVAAAKTPPSTSDSDDDEYSPATSPSPSTSTTTSALTSPSPSPFAMSPWTQLPGLGPTTDAITEHPTRTNTTGLLGSLVKAEGHVYSLAASGDLLYTGTDSRTVRVWRGRRDVGAFRAGSGLVKAVVVGPDGRIFTGHQDGKIRVWRQSSSSDHTDIIKHRRVGSLPRVRDAVASSLTKRAVRHVDAVSCLSLDPGAGLLYSGSWDKSVKVWRVSDSRCVESVHAAHDDAVNAVAAAGFDALLLTASADGTVKVWRRHETVVGHHRTNKTRTKHVLEQVLREGGDGAVTSVAVCDESRVVYAGSSDGAVTHWKFPRGRRRDLSPRNGGALRGHGKMAVLCVAVAAGGGGSRVVASGSADRTVCVWRREAGGAEHVKVAVLRGHVGPVKCVAVDQEEEEGEDGGRRWVVYSGSLDGSVKVWRVSDDRGSPELAGTPLHAQRAWRKGATAAVSAPPVVRSWTPYAAAPEHKRMAAA